MGFGPRLIGSYHLYAGGVEMQEPAGVLSAKKMFNRYLTLFAMPVVCRRRVLVYVSAVSKSNPRSSFFGLGLFLKILRERLCTA
jgi:hypothetical protein